MPHVPNLKEFPLYRERAEMANPYKGRELDVALFSVICHFGLPLEVEGGQS